MVNSRFTVAIHVLCVLASQQGQPVTSEIIAGSVNTNPVVIRRILALFRKAGLVKSQPGVAGGWELIPKPSKITLAQVFRIVLPKAVFAMHSSQPNPLCPIGRNVQKGLSTHYRKAQDAMERQLAETTISEVLKDTLAAGK
jgi:Rrf2 family protein